MLPIKGILNVFLATIACFSMLAWLTASGMFLVREALLRLGTIWRRRQVSMTEIIRIYIAFGILIIGIALMLSFLLLLPMAQYYSDHVEYFERFLR